MTTEFSADKLGGKKASEESLSKWLKHNKEANASADSVVKDTLAEDSSPTAPPSVLDSAPTEEPAVVETAAEGTDETKLSASSEDKVLEVPSSLLKESVKAETGFISVNKRYEEGRILKEETIEEETIQVRPWPRDVPVAHVEYSSGLTINVGDYNSVKIHISVTLPSLVEELPAAYIAASEFVNNRLVEETKNVKRK